LAIFLRAGVKGKSAVSLAQDLLARFQGMQGLVHANPEDICNCFGMGLSKWAQIQAAYELVKRCLQETLYQGAIFSSPSKSESSCRPKLDDCPMRFSYVCI